ncbi:cation-transporting P-type ATPase [Desulfobulbus alkaliphilus]|uniref:cation-transporting P-type ATPase n=1 Tax=Desulfobulbus alkaliphilus TaxID=869814 RepID=UPI0019633952|nr:cation-transporting P-type ATPase [Desulfobulbus alkaliphilus]MBM9536257.1 cation-transporting P-type ATPase [Desulfobulbus alkaliphilus]
MKNNSKTLFHVDTPYALEADEVVRRLESRSSGLHTEEAKERLAAIGPNRLPTAPKEGLLKRFFKHFNELLIYILLVAAVVTALLGYWIDTGVILAVVVINAVIGFIQEGKAEQALESIRKMLSLHAQVRRDGQWLDVEADQLVPGDVVRLRSGDRVPADIRLVETINLRIEESALTGESVASDKQTASVAADAGIGDRHGMAYSGTMVSVGRGIGVVTATGVATELGRINTMISEVETLATPLTRQMNSFGRILAVVIVSMAVLLFLIGRLLHGFAYDEVFLAAIGFAVAAIPEGLPAILTITLALGVQRMAQRNAITRKLKAIETLGSVTVICSDKTGTLTKNEMTVRDVVTRSGCYDIKGAGYAPEGEMIREGEAASLEKHPDLRALVEVVAVCNDAEIVEENGHWRVLGEPTEGALRTLARKAGFEHEAYDQLAEIPFESENKFMATLNRDPEGEVRILLKGAPDRLLDRCQKQLATDGSTEALQRSFWEEEVKKLSSQGLRVLAAASRDVWTDMKDLNPEDLEEGMVFIGLVGILDPPRPEAIDAIRSCRRAGIRVKMITGDHAGTAIAICREMDLSEAVHAISGKELEAASDEELRHLVQENDIFARTSPEHKLRLVKALQANGEVVAMTGDGVNDAPALKRADVGVAMGIKGTEATKEAAEIVLADDNFISIEHAVKEGRTIYDNLRKAIMFILPTNGAQGLVILAAVVFGMVLPLTPVQILWVNMVVAVTLALALAFEPAEPAVMTRPPRRPDAPILGAIFLWRIFFVSVLIGGATIFVFLVERRLDMPLDQARTLAVNTLVFGQIFYLFNSRFLYESSMHLRQLFTNGIAWLAVAILIVLQLAFVYAPFMQHWFGTASLELIHWLIPVAIGLAVFFIVEIEKSITLRMRNNR